MVWLLKTIRCLILILPRGRNMFFPREAYGVYGFFMGVKLESWLPKMPFVCKYRIWKIVNLLAIIAERGLKKERDSLPDGISHHTAQLLAIMSVAILHDNEARAEILMFDQSQQEVNDKVPLVVDWELVEDRHGVIFSTRAISFISALCRYGDHDAAVFEKTVRIFNEELGGCIDWGDENDETGPEIILEAKIHKMRERYLRILDRFIRQMEEYAARLGALDVLREWQDAGRCLRDLRSMRVIVRFDWEIQRLAHKVCALINDAMSDTMALHMMETQQAVLLPSPPHAPKLLAPVEGVSKHDLKKEMQSMSAKLTRNINNGVKTMVRATNETPPGQVPGKRGRVQSAVRCRQFEKAVLYKMTHEDCSRRNACIESFAVVEGGYTSSRSIEDYWREHPADADRVELMFTERNASGVVWEALQKEYGIVS